MTTLRSFQNEIDEIHNRELSKQRTAGATILEKDKDKENKGLKGKSKEDTDTPLAKEDQPDNSERNVGTMDKNDDQILNLLLSKEPSDRDTVRDRIAALLTQNNGEY